MAIPQSTIKNKIGYLLATLLLLGGSFALHAQNKHIDLTVYHDGTNDKMSFINSECPNRPQDMGCIQTDNNSSPIISWELDSDSNRDWELTRLQFSPDGQNWGDRNFPLQDCTMDDFQLNASDANSGNASSASVTANGRRLQIHDLNDNQCRTHYKLFARPRAGGAEINSDPVIDNTGR
jgi:hypothetical protein